MYMAVKKLKNHSFSSLREANSIEKCQVLTISEVVLSFFYFPMLSTDAVLQIILLHLLMICMSYLTRVYQLVWTRPTDIDGGGV